MDEYNLNTFTEVKEPKRGVRKFMLIVLLVVVGSASFGVGLTIGNHVLQSIAQAISAEETPVANAITSVRVNPLAIPINPQDGNIADMIPLVKDSVVSISVISATNRPFGRVVPGSGSGFIFYEDDDYVFIATNNHVVENTSSISISLDDNASVPAHVVGADHDSDLAVIAVRRADLAEKGVPYTVANLGDSAAMRMGDTVVAIGNAMGEGQTVTKGIVSAMGLTITISDPGASGSLTLYVMQTDAAVNRGNSGGPLFNRDGEVVGIVTAKLMGSHIEGMGYAIPINEAFAILQELKENSEVSAPFMGINHEHFSEFRRSLFNMPYTGTLVTSIGQGLPAYEAGIRPGDLIIYINDTRIYGMEEFVTTFNLYRPGDTIMVTVFREGERLNFNITLIARPH